MEGCDLLKRPTEMLTRRSESLLANDMAANANRLTELLAGKSCLVIGGAGSIGSETTLLLAQFPLSRLTIIDQDENGLARLVRRLRGNALAPATAQIDSLPMDYGSTAFFAMLRASEPYDYVLNFAALKHVRSEKQPWSIFAMMDTNILKQSDLLSALSETGKPFRYFSVSTDKAANPVSFMGATKRLMEHVMFTETANVSSARFANVAYSQGSLLESFCDRLDSDTPLAAPLGIERFFFTLEEAGQMCLLTGILGETGKIYIPDLSPEEHLVSMETAAISFLEANGYEAIAYPLEKQTEAFSDFAELKAGGKWPLILTPSDTAGEKPYEEFAGEKETVTDSAFAALKAVNYAPSNFAGGVNALSAKLRELKLDTSALSQLSTDDMKAWVSEIEPNFEHRHIGSEKTLDDRI